MTTYRSRPLLTIRPDWSDRSEMTARQLDELRIESAGAGLAVPWSAGTAIRRRGEFSVLLNGVDAIADLIGFFDDRKGRRKGFWVPTWLGDFRLLSDATAGASTLTIEAVGLGDLIDAHGEQFRHLALIRGAVWTGAEAMELHRIASVVRSGETEIISLDAPLSADIDHQQTVCCPLLYARFSTDDLELRYGNESTGAARAWIGITELPTEYGTAQDGDAPIWLYEFRRGENVTIRVADWGEDVTRGGETYAAASIGHNEIRSSAELLFAPIEIRAKEPASGGPLRSLAEGAPEPVMVRIWRASADDSAAPVLEFAGEMTGRAVRAGGDIVFTTETRLGAAAGEEYPRSGFERYDNGHVYDDLNEQDWTTSGTVSGVGPDWIEAVAFGAKATSENAPQWFAGGTVRIGGEERLCRFQDGARLYLSRPISGVDIGDPVSASAGYDRSLSMRADRFNDAVNHRGFPYMPDRNLLFEPLEIAQDISARKK